MIDNIIITRVGLKVVAIIKRRTLGGKFLPGSSPGADSYSTKPFAMPLYAAGKTLGKRIIGGSKKENSEFTLFTSKRGNNLWVVIHGGYKRLRQLGGRQSEVVDLNWSGRMMRNLNILPGSVTDGSSIELGFDNEEANKIASYHNIYGAGKNKIKRVFMGLTIAEQKEIASYAGSEAKKKLNDAIKKWKEQFK